MSVFKSQFTRALRAHPSDFADVAYPNVTTSGANTSGGAFKLINSAATFVTNGVRIGDIVHNDTLGTAATVTFVDSQTTLTMNADIFVAPSQTYKVYASSSFSGYPNTGCFLYVGGAGNVSVVTIGGDIITFIGVAAGTTLPIQVMRLRATSTTATQINAMW
jgi:hypothetical protein